MNITIIIPAIRLTKKEVDSPQPTTPFPPINITPSPLPIYSMTSSASSSYSNITQLCSECSSSLKNIHINRESFQNNLQESESTNISNKNNLSSEIFSILNDLTGELNTPSPLQENNSNHKNPTIHEIGRTVNYHDSESFEARTTESASSPETVINLCTLKEDEHMNVANEVEDEEYRETNSNSTISNTLYEQLGELIPIIYEHSPTPEPPHQEENEENTISNTPNSTQTDTNDPIIKAEGKKIKIKKKTYRTYPDPRKPSNFPQRLNKLTLARQALAREKRRVYVEERIQQYMRNAQQILSYRSPPKSLTQMSDKSDDSLMTSSLCDEIIVEQPLSHVQNRSLTSAQSLPNIDNYSHSNNSIRFSPSPLPKKVHTGKSQFRNSYYTPNSASSLPPLPLPRILFKTKDSNNYEETIPEQETELWSGVEHQGYFYSFRVRENGPVQMLNKSVQTADGMIQEDLILSSKPLSEPTANPYSNSTHTIIQSTTSIVRIPILDDRDKILREITETVQLRHDAELRRAELIQRANDLQTRVKEKREKINQRHEFWHKKYTEESSLTRPLESACTSLRGELNNVHKRLLAHLEGQELPLRLRDGPSKKANYKIMATRLHHEIKELQQKAKAAKLRLESETKLKEQADRETRDIRNDLSHKKVVMSLAKSQTSTLPTVHPRSRTYETLVY